MSDPLRGLSIAIARYQRALQDYELALLADRGAQPSWSVIEHPKIEIADEVLKLLGLPTAPEVLQ